MVCLAPLTAHQRKLGSPVIDGALAPKRGDIGAFPFKRRCRTRKEYEARERAIRDLYAVIERDAVAGFRYRRGWEMLMAQTSAIFPALNDNQKRGPKRKPRKR